MFSTSHHAHPHAHSLAPKLIALVSSLAMIATLSACSSSTPSDTSQPQTTSTTEGFPVTLESPFGTTTITEQPKRVAAIGWTNQDAALALGVVPVDIPKMTYGDTDGDGLLEWTKDALDDLGATGSSAPQLHDETDAIDVEAIAAAEPDVILGVQSGLTQEQFDTLSQIAPVVAYPDIAWGAPWREVVSLSAKALGKAEEGKKLIASTEETIANEMSQYPDLEGLSAAVVYFDTAKMSGLSVYTTNDPREKFVEDLGLTTPESVKKLSEGNTEFYQTVSSEHADDFDDVDIMITYGDESTLEAIQADPLMSKIPAVKCGSVVVIDESTSLAAAVSPSVLSIPATISEYASLLASAADKVN